MTRLLLIPTMLAAVALPAADANWAPAHDAGQEAALKDLVAGRVLEVFRHGVKPEWGYAAPQQDAFVVVHPKTERKGAPLYVVLHSAGHDVFSCVKCTPQVGNHDIYRSPDDFYALYLDCRANQIDWWWGAKDPDQTKPAPVERRVVDTVKWAIQTYAIDPERVYLCGNSMGGSGTLGIGMRNGDLFAAIKANVPAGVDHVSSRMYFPPLAQPAGVKLPDPPVAIDYSAQNDTWSAGHERFIKAMNDRRYALFFYWGPFGHGNNSSEIKKHNDLIDSFDWLAVKRNEAYAVFTNADSNSAPIPWPDDLKATSSGQINAFFRWKTLADTKDEVRMSLFLVTSGDLKTTFAIPAKARADVSLRRIQHFLAKPGQTVAWSFGTAKGKVKADADGLITIPGLTISAEPATLTLGR